MGRRGVPVRGAGAGESQNVDGPLPVLARWRRVPVWRYARFALVSGVVAAATGFFAVYARATRSGPGGILLFQREEWRFWTLGVGLAVVAAVLTARLSGLTGQARAHRTPFDEVVALPTGGVFAAVATFGAVLTISIYHSMDGILVLPVMLWILLCAGLVTRAHLEDELGTIRHAALTAHVLLTHLVAFLTLAMIYINKVRSLLSATTVALVTGLLLLQLTDGERYPAERRVIYGLVGAVILGEVTWALNYWPLTGWTGGALLLVTFYLLAGLILAQVRGGLRASRLAEYGLVSAVAFGAITYSLWRGP